MPDALTVALALDQQRCPRCAAVLRVGARQCWLCHAGVVPSATPDSAPPPRSPSVRARPERLGGYSLASLMMFVTLVCVILGVSSLWLGVGIPLGIVLLVVWLRTTAVVRYRYTHGETVGQEEKLRLLLASFGATVALLAVTFVAGCAAFVAGCFACVGIFLGLDEGIGAGQGVSMTLAWTVFGIIAIAIAGPVLWWIAKEIRRRWRRDIGEDVPADRTYRRLRAFVITVLIVVVMILAGFGLLWVLSEM
jgi:hypothetical protein